MDLLKTLYGVIGAAYPIASIVIAALAGAVFFGGGWWLIGKEYEKGIKAAAVASGESRSSTSSPSVNPVPPPGSVTAKPTASFGLRENDNGSATLVLKFFDVPRETNVDWIALSLKQIAPETGIAGNPSAQVTPVTYDVSLSPADFDKPDPAVMVESRLIPSGNEPYGLAEITLWWRQQQSQVALSVKPSFFDGRRKPLPIASNPDHVNLTLRNYSNTAAKSRQ